MKLTFAAATLTLAMGLSACGPADTQGRTEPGTKTAAQGGSISQAELQRFADGLKVRYRVLSNVGTRGCDAARADGRCFSAAIDFTSSVEMRAKGWAIYFSQMRPVQVFRSQEFNLSQVKGDLHKLTPTPAFNGFRPGETHSLSFLGDYWQLSEIDAMPNYYLVAAGLKPVVIASTRLSRDPDTGLETRPYVEDFVDAERQYKRSETDAIDWAGAGVLFEANAATPIAPALALNSIIPTPKTVIPIPDVGPVSLANGIEVVLNRVPRAEVAAALARLARLGVAESDTGVTVNFLPPAGAGRETDTGNEAGAKTREGAYRLEIRPGAIDIRAADAAGFSYGLASLAGLVDVNSLKVNALSIEDSPRYPFRGMHVDVARNFHSKAFILKLLDQMAAYKLNKLHLHMADDEGWRLEIEGLPELTGVGSKRCHDLTEDTCLLPQLGSGPDADTEVSGYYSKADYIEILQYAAARQIEVIPSMDMPGHSRAAIKSMAARSRSLSAAGEPVAAAEYNLVDPLDQTSYASVQYYDDNTLNVCLESSYHFVEKVIDEIAELHRQAGQPLRHYHIGADETAGAWVDSPVCRHLISANADSQGRDADEELGSTAQLGAYFIERIAKLLQAKGIEAAGWSDGMSHTRAEKMPAKVQSNVWDIIAYGGHVRAHQQANLGWDTVLSNPEVLYFDFPYEADPKEPGYYWGTRRNNSRHVFSFMPDNLAANAEQWTDIQGLPFEADDRLKLNAAGQKLGGPLLPGKRFQGIQGQLWSETLRSDAAVEYMVFPRLLMLAERAWHKADWEVPYQYQGALYNRTSGFFSQEMRAKQAAQWSRMANTLGSKELRKLDLAGIRYRVPTPGARIVDGNLVANVIFPGLGIEYREAGGQWQPYAGPVAVKPPLDVRVLAADGRRRGRSLTLIERRK
ncbi:carbohydate-binding domain-containing protein [Shewanella sp. AS16]|uniref:family 20 glycosylhydrolase n=1 Tax=Shewanella sp. AS16 TaxID=2907625 RepID=UPI001F315CAE|nr:family 20 glycosylhydrolase [Shewanella sp. AS16]MCE9685263.1 carbohydate-binding domain-containing protein [Shewanella sp. AS16]